MFYDEKTKNKGDLLSMLICLLTPNTLPYLTPFIWLYASDGW